MPPVVFIHMPRDAGMDDKVQDNIAVLEGYGVPAAEIRVSQPRLQCVCALAPPARGEALQLANQRARACAPAQVDPRPITPTFFSDLDPLFSIELSADMHAALAAQGYLDAPPFYPPQRTRGTTFSGSPGRRT